VAGGTTLPHEIHCLGCFTASSSSSMGISPPTKSAMSSSSSGSVTVQDGELRIVVDTGFAVRVLGFNLHLRQMKAMFDSGYDFKSPHSVLFAMFVISYSRNRNDEGR
jgi:hypothetical protein